MSPTLEKARWALACSLIAVLLGVSLGLPVRPMVIVPPDRDGSARETEFSLEEFYDIKRTVETSRKRDSSAALREARSKSEKLVESLPKIPRFYGQDHYEQSFGNNGKEKWIHVGRPDEFVYDLFFKHPSKYNGTFVEVGAGDGVRASNTLFFEESLGWTGLLIEGSTENFLQMFGGGRRRRSVLTYSAVCHAPGRTKFVGDGMAAGAVEDMTRHHIESWGHHFKSMQVYEVPCDRLGAIVRRARLPRQIDFLSVDVEGGELRALETFNWEEHSVRVLTIEAGRSCFPFSRSKNVCAELLRKQGFCLVARRAVNEYWVSDAEFKQMFCH